MITVLKSSKPKARKQHHCSLCTGAINPGQTYCRSTIVNDGNLYDWIDCNACTADRILTLVSAYFDSIYGEGCDSYDAVEWAWEVVRNDLSLIDDVMVAQRYLDRAGIDWRAEL